MNDSFDGAELVAQWCDQEPDHNLPSILIPSGEEL